MTEWVGVIVKKDGSEPETTPLKEVVRKDVIVDGVAKMYFADGSTEEVRDAVGYYGRGELR